MNSFPAVLGSIAALGAVSYGLAWALVWIFIFR